MALVYRPGARHAGSNHNNNCRKGARAHSRSSRDRREREKFHLPLYMCVDTRGDITFDLCIEMSKIFFEVKRKGDETKPNPAMAKSNAGRVK